MKYQYEIIKSEDNFLIKAIIHSIYDLEIHWRNEMKILLL